jgi:hypothetical protein
VSGVKPPPTYDEVRARVDKLKKDLAGAEKEIKQLWADRAWEVLGYPNWDAFVKNEFGGCMLRVPKENLAEFVRSMNVTMGVRPIGEALGVSRETVRRAARQGDTNVSPAKPKAAPKPDRYLQQWGDAYKQYVEGALQMQRLCKDPRFLRHHAALVKEYREGVVWGRDLAVNLVPNFDDPNVVQLDQLDDEDNVA